MKGDFKYKCKCGRRFKTGRRIWQCNICSEYICMNCCDYGILNDLAEYGCEECLRFGYQFKGKEKQRYDNWHNSLADKSQIIK